MTNKNHKVNLVAIAGGSASGKTTVAKKIAEACKGKDVIFIEMDNYYKDLSHLSREERKKTNFDHPNAFDFHLLIHNLEQLLLGNEIEEPIYDFKVNSRSKKVKIIKPGDVIIFDGIFALENQEIRNKATINIYVDTDSDIRLVRRIARDVNTRGRTLDSVLEQYTATVKPMHDAFVEPTKRFADIIIPFDFHNIVAIDIIATKIKALIK
ncbi:uridine kinase [Spiroplasma platyhelix]|uniref:Uridine kinase n=1 Tax=Spiroplasma platyhelix PALS-1 TaxID=1276218 RepID=A0A846TW20_9MOLU|nr:uridine kinase [Spiroplasma platyhelix]MBE4703808.1 Uridine kinase [Spiroplasma platyhelix PALS-1]NKE38181.1 uridine kinase [Spiroplasma platyhelix PALS-1]UJB29066.1 uridine kinase [Spiroplasma platyhelix PALS-1]